MRKDDGERITMREERAAFNLGVVCQSNSSDCFNLTTTVMSSFSDVCSVHVVCACSFHFGAHALKQAHVL